MSEISPFGTTGSALVRLGYSAIPISPTDKYPARFAGGQWYAMKDWSRYCGELPGAFMLATWAKWPATNVGVALGRVSNSIGTGPRIGFQSGPLSERGSTPLISPAKRVGVAQPG